MQRFLIGLGGLLIVGAGAWQWLAVPRLTERLPEGWRWSAEFIGVSTFADPATGRFPDKDPSSLYLRRQEVVARDSAASVTVRDTYRTRDVTNGKTTYEYILDARVDPRTGAHLDGRYLGDQFVFPRHTGKRTYRLRFSYLKGYALSFVREEQIDGLQTYVFEYTGPAEYTESYAGTANYEGTKTTPAQEIRCRDAGFVLRLWVEPDTGSLVKLDESCYGGDYIVDRRTGARVKAVARWGGTTAGDELADRVNRVRRERLQFLAVSRYAAASLVTIGLLALAAGAWRARRRDA